MATTCSRIFFTKEHKGSSNLKYLKLTKKLWQGFVLSHEHSAWKKLGWMQFSFY